MTTPRIVACGARKCVHFQGAKGLPSVPLFVCIAFPKGIPDDILDGGDPHVVSREGDEGVTYEPQRGRI